MQNVTQVPFVPPHLRGMPPHVAETHVSGMIPESIEVKLSDLSGSDSRHLQDLTGTISSKGTTDLGAEQFRTNVNGVNQMDQATASNFPGIFSVQGENHRQAGLEGKDAVLIDVTTRSGQTATESLRLQLLAVDVHKAECENMKVTMAAECNVTRETLISRFEAKNNQREIEEKIRVDGEKTRDLIKAQEERRLTDLVNELRSEVKRLTPVAAPVAR